MERKKTSNKRCCNEPSRSPTWWGEGKTSGGRSPVSPWGQSAKVWKPEDQREVTNLSFLDERRGINNDKISLERSFCSS